MRLIKLGLISVIVMTALMLLLSLMFPSVVIVSRATDIHAPKSTIFPLVRNMNFWNKWVEGMNNANVVVYNEDSAKLGSTIVRVMGETDTTIISKWYTVNAAEQESTIRFITNTSQNITVVQWQFTQHIKWYPWEKFASMMNDKIIGARIEQNLANLKKLLEEGG